MKRLIKPVIIKLFSHLKFITLTCHRLIKNKNNKYTFEDKYKIVQNYIDKACDALNLKIILEGEDNLPSEDCLFVPNHLSSADPLALMKVINKAHTYVGKIELSKNKVLSNAIKSIEGLFIDRNDAKQALGVMKEMESELLSHKSFVIFAEGGVNLEYGGLIKEMYPGSFRAAIRANVPIVPIAIFGSQYILKDKPIYKTYPVIIKILKPLYPDEYKELRPNDIAEIVRSRINKCIAFDLRSKIHELMIEYNKDNHIFNRHTK